MNTTSSPSANIFAFEKAANLNGLLTVYPVLNGNIMGKVSRDDNALSSSPRGGAHVTRWVAYTLSNRYIGSFDTRNEAAAAVVARVRSDGAARRAARA